MNNEWYIKIIDVGYKLERDIYIFRQRPDGKAELIDGTVHTPGDIPKPTLSLTVEQMQKFAEALNELGINPQKEYVEGKLEATENHLKDMRKLLKLN